MKIFNEDEVVNCSKIIMVPTMCLVMMGAKVVTAPTPDYGYGEIGYYHINIDMGPSPDGFAIAGSIDASEHVFLRFGLSSVDENFIDIDQQNVGVGIKNTFGEASSLYAVADLLRADFTLDRFFGPSESDDDTGYVIELGTRSILSSWFELNVFANHTDLFDDTYSAYGLGLLFIIQEKFGISIKASRDSDQDVVSFLSLRLGL